MIPDYETLYRQYIKGVKQSASDPDQFVGFCSFHDDKKNRSFSFNGTTGLSNCFSGCFQGNAYQFAEAMSHPNPSEWIDNTDKQPQPLNPKNRQETAEIDLLSKAKCYQNNLLVDWINESKIVMKMLVGEDKQGRLTFPYFDKDGKVTGIKHHKGKNGERPYWEGDGTCKWYGLQLLKGFDRNKPLYICEGERDCIRMLSIGFQTTTGSAGAGSIPRDMNPIYEFTKYIIIYDNDSTGYSGAEKLAKRLGDKI